MSQALQTDVSILNLLGGHRDRSAPTVRVIEPDAGIAPAEGKGNLYILVELAGPDQGRGRLYRDLLGTIQETYYYHSGDVASALTAALRAAHASIQQYNLYHSTRFSGGATCLVVTGAEIVSAQAGPTILAVRSAAGLQWFSPLNNERYLALGEQAPPPIEIGRVPGQPGTVIVAMNSAWATHLEVPVMREATSVPRAQAVADQLAGVGINMQEELTLIVIALAASSKAKGAEPAPAAVMATTTSPRAPQTMPVTTDAANMAVGEGIADGTVALPSKKTGLGFRGKIAAMGGAAAGSAADRGASSAPREAAPERGAVPRKTGTPSRRIPYVLIIVGALAATILLITGGVWYVQNQQRAKLFDQYLTGVQVQYDAAQKTQVESEKRQYLRAAEEQLQQAAEFFPQNEQVLALRNKVSTAKAEVNHIQPLLRGFDLPLIQFDGATRDPSRVYVNGLNVFVLDTQQGQGKLERYQLDKTTGDRLASGTQPEALIQTGTDVGGRRIGELAQSVWAPAAGNRTATGPLVLDRSNQLFSNVEGLGPVNVTMANNDKLGFVRDMEFYNGNLYFLDTNNSQVWRYRSSGDGYADAPEPYFTEGTKVNISSVIDSAIDGTVWLLHPNGTVLKYFNGGQEAFALDVIDPPIGNAVTMWVNEAEGPDGRLFLGDAATDRVLVFDKLGKLLSQLTPVDHAGSLKDMRSIYVDENTNFLYIVTDTAVYQTPLPQIANAS